MFPFASPWALVLLIFVPFAVWRRRLLGERAAVRFSSLETVRQVRPGWRPRLLALLPWLRGLILTLLVVAMARPQEGRKQAIVDREGIAIQMVIDRSGSMQALDFQLDRGPVNRLDAVKEVATRFVTGGKGLTGRFDDLVGLVTFARFADSLCPLTLDHAYLVGRLKQTEIVVERGEDGTAIGDAIGLAIEKLNALKRDARRKIKSRVIILLTDGENNSGDLSPEQASELAAQLEIRIYTIGVGTKGLAPVPVTDVWGRTVIRQVPVSIDETTLKEVARATSGKYFRATDTRSLEQIYREIDRLEKSQIRDQPMLDYRELAIDSGYIGSLALPPLVLLALMMLAVECFLAETLLAFIP